MLKFNRLVLVFILLASTAFAEGEVKTIETENGKYEVLETSPEKTSGKMPLLVIAPAKEYTMTGALFEKLAAKAAEQGYFVVRFNWKFISEKKKTATDLKAESKDLAAVVDFYARKSSIEAGHIVIAAKSFGSRAAMKSAALKKAGALLLITPNCDKTDTFEKTYGPALEFEGPVQIVISVTDPYCDVRQIYAAAGRFDQSTSLFTLAGDHNFETKDASSALNQEAAITAMANWLAQLR